MLSARGVASEISTFAFGNNESALLVYQTKSYFVWNFKHQEH
jgi:hypothetical protein